MEMRIGVGMRMRVGLCGHLTQSGDQNISRSSNKLHTSGLEGDRERKIVGHFDSWQNILSNKFMRHAICTE